MAKEKLFHCVDCNVSAYTFKEIYAHTNQNDHGWTSTKIEKIPKDGTWVIGYCGFDSGCCMIGDPCYQLPNHTEYDTVQDWKKFCKFRDETNHNPTELGLSVVFSTGGDGSFPVIAKIKDGSCQWVKIQLTGTTKYPDLEFYTRQIDIVETRKTKKLVWK